MFPLPFLVAKNIYSSLLTLANNNNNEIYTAKNETEQNEITNTNPDHKKTL